MGTPRRAAPAMWNPQCEEGAGGGAASATWRGGGREGVSVRDIKGGGADGVLHRLRRTPMWMLRGWRTQGRGHGSVDGVEVEGAGKRDEVGDTGMESLWSLFGGLLGVVPV